MQNSKLGRMQNSMDCLEEKVSHLSLTGAGSGMDVPQAVKTMVDAGVDNRRLGELLWNVPLGTDHVVMFHQAGVPIRWEKVADPVAVIAACKPLDNESNDLQWAVRCAMSDRNDLQMWESFGVDSSRIWEHPILTNLVNVQNKLQHNRLYVSGGFFLHLLQSVLTGRRVPYDDIDVYVAGSDIQALRYALDSTGGTNQGCIYNLAGNIQLIHIESCIQDMIKDFDFDVVCGYLDLSTRQAFMTTRCFRANCTGVIRSGRLVTKDGRMQKYQKKGFQVAFQPFYRPESKKPSTTANKKMTVAYFTRTSTAIDCSYPTITPRGFLTIEELDMSLLSLGPQKEMTSYTESRPYYEMDVLYAGQPLVMGLENVNVASVYNCNKQSYAIVNVNIEADVWDKLKQAMESLGPCTARYIYYDQLALQSVVKHPLVLKNVIFRFVGRCCETDSGIVHIVTELLGTR